MVECTKVLLVDQELGECGALQQGLRKHGYELHTTETPPHALALASAHHYKVAFVALPLLCNPAFLTALRDELPELSVIIVLPTTPEYLIPASALEVAVSAVGKPLLLEPCRLLLDRTLELSILRAQVRQHRQFWSGMSEAAAAPATLAEASAPALWSFDAILTTKLRHMVPHLEVLGQGSLHRVLLSHVEKLLLTAILTECRGNQVRAADILGINRNTLRKKIREFGIAIARGGGSPG